MSPFKIPAANELPATSGYLGEGTHDVTIDEIDTGESSKGNPQIIVTYKNQAGQTIRDWVTITERAMWRVQALWEAAGLHWPQDGGEVDETDLIGRRLLIVVAPEEYQGVVRDKVKSYEPVVGSDLGFAPAVEPTPASGGDSDPIPFLWDGPREYDQRYHAQRSL